MNYMGNLTQNPKEIYAGTCLQCLELSLKLEEDPFSGCRWTQLMNCHS